jgi:lysyl-tRNA synthetase, class II
MQFNFALSQMQSFGLVQLVTIFNSTMNPASPDTAPIDENSLIAERRQKLKALREQGQAYPNDFKPRDKAAALQAAHASKDRDALLAEAVNVCVSGRMVLKRIMGKACFATIQDTSGRIQLYITADDLGEATLETFKHYDLGDILGAEGTLFLTKTGELSVRAKSLRLIAKALRPLPDKFHGMEDVELRYRQRYVDLIVTPEARERFLKRSAAITAIRNYMVAHEFLEVETPMLHPIPGGAAARPFVTHHNALDQSMYLRIAPELYLKRLVVGGFDRVFEINRNFRNEGVSVRHNPEFTMMEFYAAYWDYTDQMDFTEALIRHAAVSACGTAVLTHQGRELDLSKPFARLSITDAILKYAPSYSAAQLQDADFLRSECKRLGSKPEARHGLGALQLMLFEETAESQLWEPTFIIDYPIEVSPLARASDTKAGLTERFELFMTGREMANGFSELNDPEDQAARFLAQVDQKDAGDEEAMYFDADYIRALEYGMPPAGGCGVGIDRIMMLLTDAPSIRDVILFPSLKKE